MTTEERRTKILDDITARIDTKMFVLTLAVDAEPQVYDGYYVTDYVITLYGPKRNISHRIRGDAPLKPDWDRLTYTLARALVTQWALENFLQ